MQVGTDNFGLQKDEKCGKKVRLHKSRFSLDSCRLNSTINVKIVDLSIGNFTVICLQVCKSRLNQPRLNAFWHQVLLPLSGHTTADKRPKVIKTFITKIYFAVNFYCALFVCLSFCPLSLFLLQSHRISFSMSMFERRTFVQIKSIFISLNDSNLRLEVRRLGTKLTFIYHKH